MSGPPDTSVPTLQLGDNDDDILAVLRQLHRAALLHPEAARALFRALVCEGRAFAQTTDGERWKERVRSSELVARALVVLETVTMFMLESERSSTTPSAVIDAVASAASMPGRDRLLERLLRGTDGSTEV